MYSVVLICLKFRYEFEPSKMVFVSKNDHDHKAITYGNYKTS